MRVNKLLDDSYKNQIAKKSKEKVEKEVELYEKLKDPDKEDMLKYNYS